MDAHSSPPPGSSVAGAEPQSQKDPPRHPGLCRRPRRCPAREPQILLSMLSHKRQAPERGCGGGNDKQPRVCHASCGSGCYNTATSGEAKVIKPIPPKESLGEIAVLSRAGQLSQDSNRRPPAVGQEVLPTAKAELRRASHSEGQEKQGSYAQTLNLGRGQPGSEEQDPSKAEECLGAQLGLDPAASEEPSRGNTYCRLPRSA